MVESGRARFTTLPRLLDLAAEFPELAPLARPAVRLHPFPGEPTPRHSSIGGPLLWPTDETWPLCPDCIDLVSSLEGTGPEDLVLPMVPLLQIFARDVPQLPFPTGCDLFQLLWCPAELHGQTEPTRLTLWRDSTKVSAVLAPAPEVDGSIVTIDDYSIPAPCALHPEAIIDFPSGWELDAQLRGRINEQVEVFHASYDRDLGAAPGAKIGGWPQWFREPAYPRCALGHQMHHLASLTSAEAAGTAGSWSAVRDAVPEPAQWGHADPSNPTGLIIQSYGNLSVFCCTLCPDRPTSVLEHCG